MLATILIREPLVENSFKPDFIAQKKAGKLFR